VSSKLRGVVEQDAIVSFLCHVFENLDDKFALRPRPAASPCGLALNLPTLIPSSFRLISKVSISDRSWNGEICEKKKQKKILQYNNHKSHCKHEIGLTLPQIHKEDISDMIISHHM
jgi:hypothetical protein